MEKTSGKNIYFIGIGGIAMSAVAGLAKDRGWSVQGSDSEDVYSPSKAVLEKFNIPFVIGYARENIEKSFNGAGPDFVIVTAALNDSNLEIAYAKEKGIEILSFPEALSRIISGMRKIVVVGTHGKSTTSGLLGHTLKVLADSSFLVGGVLVNYESNFYSGSGPDMVVEGDEYISSDSDRRPKFMHYHPDILLINNIDFDHPDVYPTLQDMKNSFLGLVKSLAPTATIIYNFDDANVREVVADSPCTKISFGFSNSADIQAIGEPKLLDDNNFGTVVKIKDGQEFTIQTIFPGKTYAYDFLGALSAILYAYPHADYKRLQEVMLGFKGIKRRFEIISDKDPIVIDDYAHHPTAVRGTLQAARQKYPGRRIVCFFEPHTYSRTKETLGDLATSFDDANLAYIAEVYPAREKRLPSSISGEEVVEKVREHNSNTHYVKNVQDALAQYQKEAKKGDIVLVMAVGAFNNLALDIKENIKF